jgi:hypothetical protein
MPALFVSFMRTAVPVVAGWLLMLAARAGIEFDSTAVIGAVTVVLALAYYLVFRVLELLGQRARGDVMQKLAGLLLGWARPPEYPKQEAISPVASYRGQHDGV